MGPTEQRGYQRDLRGQPSSRETYCVDELDLLDWRRRIFELYRQVRHQSVTDPKAAWSLWRSTRDELFRTHPQSPLSKSQRKDFEGVPYFDYDPRYRLEAEVRPAEPERFEIP